MIFLAPESSRGCMPALASIRWSPSTVPDTLLTAPNPMEGEKNGKFLSGKGRKTLTCLKSKLCQ